MNDFLKTKERIIFNAARLFATKGYGAVSVRDIADSVGVKPAAIYNHFMGKEDVLEGILVCFSKAYKEYFEALDEANSKAVSVEEVLDNMFMELKDMMNEFTYYGIAIVLKEQFHNRFARKLAFELFHKSSIDHMQSYFDKLVSKGLLQPFDTKTLATTFMYCVLIGNELRVHELLEQECPVDCNKMYESLHMFILDYLNQKKIENK